MKLAKHLKDGYWAEEHACKILRKKGLRLIERNYNCRFGEIDLVMQDGEYLVFVEVRLRKNTAYGAASETVDWRKQQKLRRTAEYYLLQRVGSVDTPCRFDIFAITGDPAAAETQWISNAF